VGELSCKYNDTHFCVLFHSYSHFESHHGTIFEKQCTSKKEHNGTHILSILSHNHNYHHSFKSKQNRKERKQKSKTLLSSTIFFILCFSCLFHTFKLWWMEHSWCYELRFSKQSVNHYLSSSFQWWVSFTSSYYALFVCFSLAPILLIEVVSGVRY